MNRYSCVVKKLSDLTNWLNKSLSKYHLKYKNANRITISNDRFPVNDINDIIIYSFI